MPILFDQDPLTGVSQYFDYDPINDVYALTTVEEVKPLLEVLNECRKNEDYSRKGIKEDWWHYASIPITVEMELRKKGISLYDKNATKQILREINTNYPYLKATHGNHSAK